MPKNTQEGGIEVVKKGVLESEKRNLEKITTNTEIYAPDERFRFSTELLVQLREGVPSATRQTHWRGEQQINQKGSDLAIQPVFPEVSRRTGVRLLTAWGNFPKRDGGGADEERGWDTVRLRSIST